MVIVSERAHFVFPCCPTVPEKIAVLADPARHAKLQHICDFLIAKPDSEYKKFMLMQSCGLRQQFPHEIFTAPDYQSIECTL